MGVQFIAYKHSSIKHTLKGCMPRRCCAEASTVAGSRRTCTQLVPYVLHAALNAATLCGGDLPVEQALCMTLLLPWMLTGIQIFSHSLPWPHPLPSSLPLPPPGLAH